MKRRFNTKKRRKFISKYIFMLFLFIITFTSVVSLLLSTFELDLNNEKIVNYILNKEDKELNLEKLNSKEFFLKYAFDYDVSSVVPVIEENDSLIEAEINIDPLVYIYNTHTTEQYSYESFEAFNINPTVVTASYILSEYLKDEEIYSVVETLNPVDILRENSWSYSKSYDASRYLITDAITKYPTINYYIDIHRDSANYDITTTYINDKTCARFMFIVGEDNPAYESNLILSNLINDELNLIHPGFTRGVVGKSGTNVNGVYNQDLHQNAILIEVGGQYNSIEEVNCSLVYLAEVLRKVINGN